MKREKGEEYNMRAEKMKWERRKGKVGVVQTLWKGICQAGERFSVLFVDICDGIQVLNVNCAAKHKGRARKLRSEDCDLSACLVSSTCSSFICQPHTMAGQSWRSPTFCTWVFCRDQGLVLPSLFPGKDSSLLWGTLEQVRHLLSRQQPIPYVQEKLVTKKGWGRYGDEHEECGEGGKEGCSAWLWLLEVVRVYQQGAVYTALPKSTTDARDAWGS